MKARAPPPPQAPEPAPRRIFRNAVPDGGGMGGVDAKENLLRPTVDLRLTLPQGYQTMITEDGSKALMDLLVELCSRYHLNPALHTLELLSAEGHPLGFKPNVLLGSLNVARVLIKEKVWEEKVVRRPAPKVPEKTVRLVVNYHRSQKAVVRVNPLVPLQTLVPVICDKCEFDPAHVLLLKDSVSRHELPLDKSLTQLEIKELYVLDQSLVLQPKMASAPALNYSGSIHSSTTSLGGTQKKGLLGIFKFSRRKSKTEATSVDMDGTDDKVVQNADRHSNGLSAAAMVPCVDARPSTLGQSQSVMNISRMSPRIDTKKRRAPVPPEAPTPTLGHYSFEDYQMSLGSESQQRKRKAPAPPPTPDSITPGPDDTSSSATPILDSHATETPTPASRTKVVQGNLVSPTTVAAQTPFSPKTVVQPIPVFAATPVPSSPAPSSSTIDSLAAQDSSSELSHSIDDSDADPDLASSICGTSSCNSHTVGGSTPTQAQPTTTSSTPSSRMEESKRASSRADQSDQDALAASSSGSDVESALNLKLDEVENNRQSAIAWLHSLQRAAAGGWTLETDVPEEETLSVGSSSGGSSLPDQGYAASEGMAEGEDSGLISSPSDTQPTSPDGSLSLDGSSGGGGERPPGPVRDNSSDSDEGCATWGSRHRHSDIRPKGKSGRLKGSYEEDLELRSRLHQTLADFEEDLADISHIDIISVKDTPYTLSTDSNEVPVSVVDMDVPVTAIDEVLEDYGHNITDSEAKPLTRTQSAGSKEKKPYLPPTNQRSASTEEEEEEEIPMYRFYHNDTSTSTSHSKITRNPTSRFGMKTFTVIPPKPSVIHAVMEKPVITITAGSIKIDEQGNMVKPGMSRNKFGGSSESGINCGEGSPLMERAKAFWSSTEKQEDSAVPHSRGLSEKPNESADGLKNTHTALSETTLKSNKIEGLKVTQSSSYEHVQMAKPKETVKAEKAKEPVKGVAEVTKEEWVEVESKISVSEHPQQPSNKPSFPPPLLPDQKRDLSFLKPSRRTSSQYVASAISKYTPKTLAKPDSIPNIPESSASLKTQSFGFKKGGRSIHVTPQQSSQLSLSDNKEIKTGSVSHPPGPKRSMSYPEYISDRQQGPEETNKEMANTATHPAPAKKPESVTVPRGGVLPDPQQVTMFGPIKKFRPVICKSVQKDTSLHTNLMEAIQTSGGKDRLKKISGSGPSSLKKQSYVEEENERSALLAAIIAQSKSGRLKKTKSEAADELNKCRKAAEEEESNATGPPSSPSFSYTPPPLSSPSAFAPPPPPPPPPVPPQVKPSVVLPGGNTHMNPAVAREAMLEAIRSGSAAERLKKVTVPTNTVQVNGRLGTIQATSSTLSQQ
ncbi:protein cordon-bleu [Diretmus argenteus]